MRSMAAKLSAGVAGVFALGFVTLAGCSLVRVDHDESLWRWYDTTALDAERAHLDYLRRRTETEVPTPGLRLERAYHEVRVGDRETAALLLREERALFPNVERLIDRLEVRWGLAVESPAIGGDESPVTASAPVSPLAASSPVVLVVPTIDARDERSEADKVPLAAFDAAAWSAAAGSAIERYVVPVQISLEVLDDVAWSWETGQLEQLPARELAEGWGIGFGYVAMVRVWEPLGLYRLDYEVLAVMLELTDKPAPVAQATLKNTARARVETVFTGWLLEDNPVGAENVPVGTEQEALPVDHDQLALGLQRGLIERVFSRSRPGTSVR